MEKRCFHCNVELKNTEIRVMAQNIAELCTECALIRDWRACAGIMKIEEVLFIPSILALVGQVFGNSRFSYCHCPFCKKGNKKEFAVNKKKQIYHCKSCYVSGDIVSLVARLAKCSPITACERILSLGHQWNHADFERFITNNLEKQPKIEENGLEK
jgi:CHC2 zinc finger